MTPGVLLVIMFCTPTSELCDERHRIPLPSEISMTQCHKQAQQKLAEIAEFVEEGVTLRYKCVPRKA